MRNRPMLRALFFNWSALLSFETVFHCLLLAAVIPLYRFLAQLTLSQLQLPVLGWEVLPLLLSVPGALLAQLSAVLLLLFFLYWDMTALLVYCDCSIQGRRLSLWRLCKGSFLAAASVLHPRRLPLLILLPLLFYAVCPLAIHLSQPLHIPSLFLDLFLAWPIPLWGAVLLPLALLLTLFPYLTGLPAAVLDRQGFWAAYRTGLRLLRHHVSAVLGRLARTLALYGTAMLALTGIAVVALALLLRFLYDADEARYLFRSALLSWGAVWALVLLLCLGLSVAALSVHLYHQYQGQPFTNTPPALTWSQRLRSGFSLACCAAVLVFFAQTGLANTILPSLPVTRTVVAHRGASSVAPENTLAALDAAIALRADMAEIDIRQTRDQAFVVIHDDNSRRVAGVDLNVKKSSLQELQALDVGTSFSDTFTGECIPTLREALTYAKDRITLMIEVKSDGPGQERRILSLIRKYSALQQCVIASKHLEVLQRMKALEPGVQTVYITSHLSPEEYALPYVDGYSIRYSALSREMAIRLRAQGKPIYGWTASTPLNIRRLQLCGVDGIVTDDVPLTQAALARQDAPGLAQRLTDFLFPEPPVEIPSF